MSFKPNPFSGLRHSVQVWQPKDGGPIRGTIPPDSDWPFGSKQVRVRAMAAMYFNHFSALSLSRRNRRLMARKKARRVYRETVAEMRAETGSIFQGTPGFWNKLGSALLRAIGK